MPHTLVTQYRYNSLNQVVEQISPDGGLSKFWYDRLGRLVFSQNAKQVLLNQYSYTRYDNLGRIEEVGQLTSATAMTQATAQSSTATTTWWTTTVNNSREQITKTVYDLAFTTLCTPAPSVLCQKNLRNRVSYTYVQPSASYSNTGLPYTSASYYSYDIHGNVDVLLQHYNSGVMQTITGNAFKRIEYKYDLISGKVNEVAYQPGNSDQFYHRYSYDAENKLTKVFTSPDRVVWEQEADYSYYRHGPLARVELGQVGVQGVDYAYTLQGWLKTVNSTAVSTTADMGGDGTLTGRKIAADVYGFALHYNSTDYKAINLVKTVVAPVTSTGLPAFKDLYNGNIAAMAVTFKHTSFGANNTSGLNQPLLYKYRYDQLNRIKEMDAYSGLNQTTNAWTFGSPLTAYQERVSYDGNGNILTYTRNGDAARTAMDNMTYSYVSGTNRLDKVVDVAPDATSNYSSYNDLRTGQLPGNYSYDAIGNLIVEKEKIGTNTVTTNITWNVYGKIASVTKSGVTTSYTYDASGNRISKTTGSKTTWYVRDASGNVMAVYESGNASVNGGNLSQIEVHLYGSSRLGMCSPNRNVQVLPAAQNTVMTGLLQPGVTRTYKRGQKFFELSNHLGNVLVTVTDRKVAIQNGTTGTILNYVADVVSGGDYYPFGMLMPSRNYSTDKYRYGFNGKDKDKEIGFGDLDFGTRIYDARIGRFLSIDPLAKDFPSISHYTFAANCPLYLIDSKGKFPIIPYLVKGAVGAIISVIMQFTINYIITGSASEAFNNINFWQVGIDGAQSILPWNAPGGKWGKAAVSAAGAIAGNFLDGRYRKLDDVATMKAVAKDFIVSYISSLGTLAAMEKLGKYMPKIANWLANEAGLSPKTIKNLTGRWAVKVNSQSPKGGELTAKVSNYLDETLGSGTVKDVEKNVAKSLHPSGGDIDVITAKCNIEVKSGGTTFNDVIKYFEIAKKEGRDFILFAPDIQGTVEKNLKAAGVTVIRHWKTLAEAINKQK